MLEHPNAQQFTVVSRYYGGTYIARIRGTGCHASCTESSQRAMDRVIQKFMAGKPCEIHAITDGTWILNDLRLVPEEVLRKEGLL